MSDLILYGDRFFVSPYVLSCVVALREKGVEHEERVVALDRAEQRGGDHLERSLTGRVPALDHKGFTLAESQAIVEYIDEVFAGPPVLPRDPQERARARQVMAWVRSDLMPIREERATTTVFYEKSEKPLSPAGEQAAARLLWAADRLIGEGKTTLGSSFSVADADLAMMLMRLIASGHEVPRKVRAYVEAVWARPSVRSFVDRQRPAYVAY